MLTPFGVSGPGTRGKPDSDLVSIAGNLGKSIGSLFKNKKAKPAPSTISIDVLKVQPVDASHDSTLSMGIVYANDKAKTSIYSDSPSFPVGSIIVRERHDEELKPLPNKVIAMVKREAGFSPNTGDWEFFMFDGWTLALQLRETTGNCAACHSQAKATDWSFRTYMDIKR